MKKTVIAFVLFFSIGIGSAFSQSVGFSYFFPKNGYFSNPVAPVNFSLPIKFGNFLQISPGIGLSNIGGMSMTGFPEEYNSNIALIGPFQSLELSLIPAIVLPFKTVKFDFSGGVFGFATFNPKLIEGNFNDMYSNAKDFDFVNTASTIDKKPIGWGFVFGGKFRFKVTKLVWGYIGANYYMGEQKMALNGNYNGVKNNTVTTGTFSFPDASLLYHGLQISVGAVFK
ncbi:MAG: hypothetical protein JXR36_11895 [Bacteroidales bacterium]|nr:hypothetical protein [Bacteroidales bacterium]